MSGAVSFEWEDVYLPRIRTEPLRLSPDRDEVRKAIETLEPPSARC